MPYPPGSFDLSAGVTGLSTVLYPLVADSVFSPVDLPDLRQLAMMPPMSVFKLQRDAASGEDGYLEFQFSDYWIKTQKWRRGEPRPFFRGGTGGTIRLPGFVVTANEQLRADEVTPFGQANVSTVQEQEMAVTAQRVAAAINAARFRDRTEWLLNPLAANTEYVCWDNQPLLSEDHLHPDGNSFSNILTAGTQVPHITPVFVPPARATATAPTMLEVYRELRFASKHFSFARKRIAQFQRLKTGSGYEVIVRNIPTMEAFEDLRSTERYGFPSEDGASGVEVRNPYFGDNLMITLDTNPPDDGSEWTYDLIPRIEDPQVERQAGVGPQNPLGLPVWQPTPRPFTFGLVREAPNVQIKYDEWDNPMWVMYGLWEFYAIGAGFPEEIRRWDPAA
jgi:hypothetical protein